MDCTVTNVTEAEILVGMGFYLVPEIFSNQKDTSVRSVFFKNREITTLEVFSFNSIMILSIYPLISIIW